LDVKERMTIFVMFLMKMGIGNNTSFIGPFLSSPSKGIKPGISQMPGFFIPQNGMILRLTMSQEKRRCYFIKCQLSSKTKRQTVTTFFADT